MGVAGWRFAHTKRNPGGRAAVVAVLEDWQVICSVVVVAGSMIMLGIMLYTICSSDHRWPTSRIRDGRIATLKRNFGNEKPAG